MSLNARPQRTRENGAALVVGLLLLMILTLLAISGMSTATMELQMAGNRQFAENAFQAAETGIDAELNKSLGDRTIASTTVNGSDSYNGTLISDFSLTGKTELPASDPASASSLGVDRGFKACHSDLSLTGTSARNATVTLTQSFYVVCPT